MLAAAAAAAAVEHAGLAAPLFVIRHVLMPVTLAVRPTVITAATKTVQTDAGGTVREI